MAADNIAFLNAARQAVRDLQDEKEKLASLELEEKKLEKSLTAEKKAVNDNVTLTIKKRKEEITDTYDAELKTAQEDLRKAKARREKAREKGVRERMRGETADLNEEIRQLKIQMTTTFKKERVPSFCKSSLFYALYFPKGIRELLLLLLSIVIAFLAIPCGIYWLLPSHETWYLIPVYFADIIVFVGLYVLVGNRTKMAHRDVLLEGRRTRNLIFANKQKIKAIHNAIRKDSNDEHYGLDEFDADINKLEGELDEISRRKQSALTVFENETSVAISDEIRGNNQARLDELSQGFAEAGSKRREAESNVKAMTITLSDEYEAYLGKDYMTDEKIGALIDILENHEATNLTEAQEVFRRKA